MSKQVTGLRRRRVINPIIRFLAVFFAVSAIYWLMDSAFHTYVFRTGSLIENILHMPSDDMWHRASIMALLFVSLLVGTRLKMRLQQSAHSVKLTRWKDSLISQNISEHLIFYNKDFYIEWANKAAASSLNMARSELIGKRCYELWHKRNEPCEGCPVIHAIETKKPQESLIITPDGRQWFIRGYPIIGKDGQLEGAAEITLEITELKEAEREARDKGARLEAILKSVSDGIAMMNPRGIVTFINESFEKMLCIHREEAIGKYINHLLLLRDPETYQRTTIPMSKVASLSLDGSLVIKGLLQCNDGTSRLISAVFSPILSAESKEVKGIVLSVRDITQNEKAIEDFLKQKKAECLGRFALGISHDLNNIIHSISSNLSLIKTELKVHDERSEAIDDIDEAAARLKELSRELSLFGGEGGTKKNKVSIGEIIAKAASLTTSEDNIYLKQSIEKGIPQIEADEEKLYQALESIMNFIKDSAKAGSEIDLSVYTRRFGEEEITGLAPGDYIVTSIKANKYLVPKDKTKDLFNPYSQAVYSGKGLKLPIAESVIESHGGSIEVSSSIESGTELKVYLPISKTPEAVATPISPGERKANYRILAMDDDEIVRRALKKILEFYGFKVELAANGEEAVRNYRDALQSRKPFDAAIIDLTVKHGMGGKETARKILEMDRKARLIISSGYGNNEVMTDYRRYGFKAAIAKPYKAEKLNEVLSDVLSIEATTTSKHNE